MFPTGSATKVFTCDQDLSFIQRIIENEILIKLIIYVISPVIRQDVTKSLSVNGLQKTGRYDLIRIYIFHGHRNSPVFYYFYFFHYKYSLTSTIFPSTAAAAAISGLAKMVRAPGPCLPSKFRLEVEIQYSPAGTLSSFIPRQAEQPDSRNSKPAF